MHQGHTVEPGHAEWQAQVQALAALPYCGHTRGRARCPLFLRACSCPIRPTAPASGLSAPTRRGPVRVARRRPCEGVHTFFFRSRVGCYKIQIMGAVWAETGEWGESGHKFGVVRHGTAFGWGVEYEHRSVHSRWLEQSSGAADTDRRHISSGPCAGGQANGDRWARLRVACGGGLERGG